MEKKNKKSTVNPVVEKLEKENTELKSEMEAVKAENTKLRLKLKEWNEQIAEAKYSIKEIDNRICNILDETAEQGMAFVTTNNVAPIIPNHKEHEERAETTMGDRLAKAMRSL